MCGKMGHLARMCRFCKGKKEEANAVEEDEMIVMITKILMVDKNQEWWVDSGATCLLLFQRCLQDL